MKCARAVAVMVVLAGAVAVFGQDRGGAMRRVERSYRITDASADAGAILDAVRKRVAVIGVTAQAKGAREIVLSIPYPEEVERADSAVEGAVDAFDKHTPKRGELEKALALAGAAREAALDGLVNDMPGLKTRLPGLEKAFDEVIAARRDQESAVGGEIKAAAVNRAYEAESRYFKEDEAFFSRILSRYELDAALDMARDGTDREAEARLEGLAEKYPMQAAWIRPAVEAQAKLEAAGGGKYVKPASFDLILRATDRLEFRVALAREQLGAAYEQTLAEFNAKGAEAKVTVGGASARWFVVAAGDREQFVDRSLVVESRRDKVYLLCYDDSEHTLLHADAAKKPWMAMVGRLATNDGVLSLGFSLDARGAGYMRRLSEKNVNRDMALLLSDEALTAPTLRGVIAEEGEISFGHPDARRSAEDIQREVKTLRESMNGLPVEVER